AVHGHVSLHQPLQRLYYLAGGEHYEGQGEALGCAVYQVGDALVYPNALARREVDQHEGRLALVVQGGFSAVVGIRGGDVTVNPQLVEVVAIEGREGLRAQGDYVVLLQCPTVDAEVGRAGTYLGVG